MLKTMQGLKLGFFVSIQVDTSNIESGIHVQKHSIPDVDTKYFIFSIQQGNYIFLLLKRYNNFHSPQNHICIYFYFLIKQFLKLYEIFMSHCGFSGTCP